MLFLVDANLPPALAIALTHAGHSANHVEDVGLRNSEDDQIWAYVLQESAVILTKDEDFPDRYLRTSRTPVIVWLRIGNCRNTELLEWFLPLLPELVHRISFGDRLIEMK